MKRIDEINKKIEKLKLQKKQLEDAQSKRVSAFIKKHQVHTIDFETLIGALHELIKNLHSGNIEKEKCAHYKKQGKALTGKKSKDDEEINS